MPSRPRVLFLGLGYAGHRVRFENLRRHTEDDPRIDAEYRLVTGWQKGGLVERLPGVPRKLRGGLRAWGQSSAVLKFPRPDIIWSAAFTAARPWALGNVGPLRRPLVLDRDCAIEARDEWSRVYWSREPHRGTRRKIEDWLDSRFLSTATWSSWSTWAAESLERAGVSSDRITVIPPGVDLDAWKPPAGGRSSPRDTVRLLFVGGDFERKGGHLLLQALNRQCPGRFELDIVTRDKVTQTAGVRVHRAEPNSPEIRTLYDAADLFVMPSLAECFGIATVEAMASGLPVIVGNTGAADEIVGGEAGWTVEPTVDCVSAALEAAWDRRECLSEIGVRARRRAEIRFDGRANDLRVVDLLLETWERSRRAD